MLGGYQILDLRGIDLTLGSSASNITNPYVLNQLRNLREHIQKDYDFAKPLNNQVKPVLIRYRDKKNGEKHEGAIFGSVQVKTNYYTYEISAILLGQTLNIEVVFEEKTNDDGEKYWDIKTAKILLTDNADIKGDLTVEGDINAEGIYGDEIIENMEGYSYVASPDFPNVNMIYGGICKNGNKLTMVLFGEFTTNENQIYLEGTFGGFNIPSTVGQKLISQVNAPFANHIQDWVVDTFSQPSVYVSGNAYAYKQSNQYIELNARFSGLTPETKYCLRIEITFLLSDNLIPQP